MLISKKPGLWARQWEHEGRLKGRKEGREEGREEGLHEGAATLLNTLLQRKFGPLPDWASARIAQADTDALQQWVLNVLDAAQIEDVFH